MFTPVILACVASACFAVSGVAYPTQETCEADMKSEGVQFVEQQFPTARILQMQCIDWGSEA